MRILAAAQRYVAEEPVTVTFRRPRSQRSPHGQCSGGPGYSGQERPARHWALVEFPFSHAAIHCIAASALTRNNAFRSLFRGHGSRSKRICIAPGDWHDAGLAGVLGDGLSESDE
jgi:hypothetical protein